MHVSLLLFHCQACGVWERAATEDALVRLQREGLCQGCRAARTLERRPALLPLFVGFWRKSGFPASSAWLAAVLPPTAPAAAPDRPAAEPAPVPSH
ncbi:MAG: hypothetical protein SCH98_10370 [Deferrisomatales bacterium]|nr:hypothetical protein [Deferrisomatales bacterium]